MKEDPRVAVVVITHQRRAELLGALDRLLALPEQPHVVVVADLARAEVVRAAAGSGADVVGVSSRRQLEEVFLGVIAAASGSDPDLRQVRSR